MNCKCGHIMAIHDEGGCQHADRTKGGIDLVCRCGLSPDAIADAQLAALREAGDKMHSLVKEFLSADENTMLGLMVIDALAEWEAANK